MTLEEGAHHPLGCPLCSDADKITHQENGTFGTATNRTRRREKNKTKRTVESFRYIQEFPLLIWTEADTQKKRHADDNGLSIAAAP